MRCFAEISVLVHATEDLDKVYGALLRTFGELPYVIEPLEGHYGNPIYLITAFMDDCRPLLSKLCPLLAGRGLEPRGELYVRLDKQRLARGELALSNSDDVVRIRIKGGKCGEGN
ncbi:MAG: RNA-binding domain-containing protein [Thermoproteus sp.]